MPGQYPQTIVGHFCAIRNLAAGAVEIFTAAEIAGAIEWSKRKVQTTLADILTAGTKRVSGNDAPAWALSAFPKSLLSEVERVKLAHHYRTAADVLRDPLKRWEPINPLARVSAAARREAEQLREALAGSLAMPDGTLPGYIGRCEAKVKHEREQRFLQSLKRTGQPRKSEVDPRKMLLSKEQISDELVRVMRAFAEEPQNGKRLTGLSPAEAWEQLSPAKPHQLLPESLRYLLTTHQSEQTVTKDGVRVKIGGSWNCYVGSERLGKLRGEKVRVFYNPELPEMVSVIHPRTDPKAAQPFCVLSFRVCQRTRPRLTTCAGERAPARLSQVRRERLSSHRAAAQSHDAQRRARHAGSPPDGRPTQRDRKRASDLARLTRTQPGRDSATRRPPESCDRSGQSPQPVAPRYRRHTWPRGCHAL